MRCGVGEIDEEIGKICQGGELWVKPFAKGLRMSTPSAKLMVRGRASRSRHKSDVNTIKSIAIRTYTKRCAGTLPTQSQLQTVRACTKVYDRIFWYA